MKKWKRALAVATATTLAVSSTSIQSLAYTEGVVEEEVVQTDSDVDATNDETTETDAESEVSNQAESDEEEPTDDTKAESEEEEKSKKELKDGLYRGSAKGFKSTVTVEVRVTGGKIESITVVSQNESGRAWAKAVAVIEAIINKQSTDVDAVSSATYSSNAIKEATRNALESEPINEEEPEEIQKLDQNSFRIYGSASLEDVQKELNIPLPVQDYDTFGGYLLSSYGSVPDDGEQFDIHFDHMDVTVKEMKNHRVMETIVNVIQHEEENKDETVAGSD